MIVEINEPQKIKNPGDVAKVMQAILNSENEVDQDKEHFWTIGLKSNNVIKYIELVSLGTIDATIAMPREIFRMAIMQGVKSIIICHNHPSGELEPSEADLDLTNRIKEAGKLLGIACLDSIIITKESFNSIGG